ncbi:MAG: class I SAM-dependent methyltransferase [Acidimicrobiales bacterium]
MEGYDASTYGDRFAEVYDDWYGDITDVEACARHLAALAGGGPALELGIGSGRLALPLVRRGVAVHGIDTSPAMIEQLRAKPGGEDIPVTLADMADLSVLGPARFTLVFVAFNTLFNLPSEAQQRRCIAGAAALLTPAGALVIEAFVPADPVAGSAEASVTPRRIHADEVVLTVSQVDHRAQTISGQHVHLRESGTRLRPWHLRYATPEQLDTMAGAAGLELVDRVADWDGGPFDESSSVHVSTYRRASVRGVPEHPPADPR